MIDRIKVRLFLTIFSISSIAAFGAEIDQLNEADSLFISQQYTQALAIYEDLYAEGNASPAMLLKMAFIKDGSGDFSEALFFLDKYYRSSADRTAVGKIEELAKANDLNGYRYNDADYFYALIDKYKLLLMLAFLSLLVLLTVYSYRVEQKGEKAFAPFFVQLFVTILILGILNYRPSPEAIIVSDQTLLRSGPSAGAEPIEMITRGHKVKVMDQEDVWTKISWDGEEVYVRNDRLRII